MEGRRKELLGKAGVSEGDFVEIEANGLKYSGVLLPRSELLDQNHLVLKLENGYNVGIEIGGTTKLTKLKRTIKLEKFPEAKLEATTSAKVSLIATGGTISSRIDYVTGGVKMASTPKEIYAAIPEITAIAGFDEISSPFTVASEDLTPANWITIAKEAQRLLNRDSNGLLITHGTDTLHFTAAALSFMLTNLTKPVAIVGSQRSSDRGSSDAFLNLVCATHLAAKGDFGEVGSCMHENSSDESCVFLRGTRVRKLHTSRRDAFRSVNARPLARIFRDGRIEELAEHRKRGSGKVGLAAVFEEKTALVKSYPGSDPSIIEWYVNKGYRGIVIEATGLGHVPSQGAGSWIPHITTAVKSGVAIVVTSQCIFGRVHPYVYRNLRLLNEAGVIWGEDLLTETAYVKLGWVLGQTKTPKEIRDKMMTPIAGEMANRTEFLPTEEEA